jgi:hypothetical protein
MECADDKSGEWLLRASAPVSTVPATLMPSLPPPRADFLNEVMKPAV